MQIWNISIQPRTYQTQATDWALARRQSVCCLPTGTGKTLVAVLWLKHLFEFEEVRRAVILEPTRLLVNQTTEYFLQKASIECIPIDGRIPRERRRELWASAELVVATPETAFNDIEDVRPDAVVVDECHHTVGQDAFARVMVRLKPKWRLGLSAFVPQRREREVTELVGPIRRWSWSDPEIAPYVPNWISEVYEGRLNQSEQSLLKTIRQLPSGPGLNPAWLERFLTRDGSAAVRETLTKKNRLAEAFGGMLLPLVPDRMHKLEAVSEVFDSHEPHKAIVFVDRVIIADRVSGLFPQMRPVLFKGKRGKFDQGIALHRARDEETRLVVSTSAGEEGIDLPSADLLVIWGNAASDIRFIQRLGRMMRKTGEGLKFATFVVTPESSDFDSFALGLAKAAEAGTIDVEKTFGWDPEVLWPRTTWWHVSELLRRNPRPLMEMADALGVREQMAQKILMNATRRGRLFYIYDVVQMVADVEAWAESWATGDGDSPLEESSEEAGIGDPEWWRRAGWNTATSMLGKARQYRIYALTDDVQALRQRYPSQFSTSDQRMLLQGKACVPRAASRGDWQLGGGWLDEYGVLRGLKLNMGQGGYTILGGLWSSISPIEDLSKAATTLAGRSVIQAIALRRRKPERLEYFYRPQSEDVLRAIVENAARFFELIDLRRQR